nr:hypothetical protein [Streptomyces sp. OV198]
MTVEQVAADFGVHAMTLWKWMRRADIDDGTKPGATSQDNAELREARRRIKLLEQEKTGPVTQTCSRPKGWASSRATGSSRVTVTSAP